MRKLILLMTVAFCNITMFAQTYEVNNVKRMSARGFQPILTNDELAGYAAFFQIESEDKKVNKYRVDLMDDNLNKAKEFFITQDAKSYLIEVVFNGDGFMLVFWTKDKTIEYLSYDKSGKLLGKYVIEKPNKYEKARIEQQLMQENIENITVFGVPGFGFVKQGWIENDKVGYEIMALNNSGKQIWTFGSRTDSKEMETADIIGVDQNYVLLNVGRKKSLMSKDVSLALIVIDTQTGKEVFEMPLKSVGNSDMNLLNAYYDEEQKKFILIGELYAPGEEPFKNQSAGLFIQELDTEGSLESTNKYLWEKEIKKAKASGMTEEQKESEKKSALYFHKVIRHKDGTISIIAEQYKKSVSALGVASVVAGGGGSSVMEMVIMNMVVMQFNAQKEITSYKIYDKKLKRVSLPGGYGMLSSAVLAIVLKSQGHFDYYYTSSAKANDEHTVVYNDFNQREEKGGAKSDIMLGILQFNGGSINASRVPLNSDSSGLTFRRAKPGYVVICEYFKKEKKAKFRLESLKK